MGRVVVKIQRPIIGKACLIYDESREISYMDDNPQVLRLLGADKLKIYFEADYDPLDGVLRILTDKEVLGFEF